MRNLKKSIKVLEALLPKLSLELDSFDTTRSDLTKLIPELESQCQLNSSDVDKLEKLVGKVKARKVDMSSCSKHANNLEAEVAVLQKEILDAGGPRRKKQIALCEKTRRQVSETEKLLNTAKVTIVSSEKAAAKAREAHAAGEKELKECEVSLESKKEERKKIEEHAFAVLQSFNKVKALEADKREALDAVNKECDDLRKSKSDAKVHEVELLSKMDLLEKQLAELGKKQQALLSSLSKLQKDMDDDDEDSPDDIDKEESENGKVVEMNEENPGSCPAETNESSKCSLPTFSPAALEKFSIDVTKEEISLLETERNSIAKSANMGAIAEYRKKEVDYLARYVTGSESVLSFLSSYNNCLLVYLLLMRLRTTAILFEKPTMICEECDWKCSWTDLDRLL